MRLASICGARALAGRGRLGGHLQDRARGEGVVPRGRGQFRRTRRRGRDLLHPAERLLAQQVDVGGLDHALLDHVPDQVQRALVVEVPLGQLSLVMTLEQFQGVGRLVGMPGQVGADQAIDIERHRRPWLVLAPGSSAKPGLLRHVGSAHGDGGPRPWPPCAVPRRRSGRGPPNRESAGTPGRPGPAAAGGAQVDGDALVQRHRLLEEALSADSASFAVRMS